MPVGMSSVRRTLATSLSYVTGSHALKAGLQWGHGWNRTDQQFLEAGPDAGFGIRFTKAPNALSERPRTVVLAPARLGVEVIVLESRRHGGDSSGCSCIVTAIQQGSTFAH